MRIKTRLLVTFLLLALLPMLIASAVFLMVGRNSLRDQALRQLQSTVSIQKQRVEAFLADNLDHVLLDANNGGIKDGTASYVQGGGAASLDSVTGALDDALASTPMFQKLSVLGLDGKVLASTDAAFVGSDQAGAPYFQKGKLGPDQSAFTLDKNDNLVEYLASPIKVDGREVGVLAVESSAKELTELMSDYTGLGKTGETVIAVKTPEGNAVFLGVPRFARGKPLGTVVPGNKSNVPINIALSNKTDVFTNTVDYRGKPVLSATAHINDPALGLVVKVDKSEAFSAINNMFAVLLVVIVAVVVIVVIVSLLLAGSITRPIVALTGVADAVSAGDLTRRSEIERDDEVGTLAKAFDKMTDDLVSEREGLELKVEERTAELALSNIELDGYAHTVSHDLRGPLASIELASAMLADMLAGEIGADTRAEMSVILAQLRTSTDRSFSLVNDLLALAEAGQQPAMVEKVEVNDVVARVLAEREPVIRAKGASVSVDEDLGSLMASPTHIYQLFSNLIGNAVKHNDSPEPLVEVRGLGAAEGGGFRYQVVDNGPGITEQDMPRIFEPFFKGEGGETGIGLATVQKIVQLYGGTVEACNEENAGACFEFVLRDYQRPAGPPGE